MFWNIMKKDLTSDIRALCEENEIHFLLLAEAQAINKTGLETELKTISNDYKLATVIDTAKVFCWHKLNNVRAVKDDNYYSAYVLDDGQEEILIVGIHAPSKIHMESSEQALFITRIIMDIKQLEDQLNITNTMVVGDFNMDPFEAGMVASESFHAIFCDTTARRGSRSVNNQNRRFFFNPMWHLHANRDLPTKGSYYFGNGGIMSYFWHMFDQVIIRPEILDRFNFDSLKIITRIESIGKSLLDANGRPNKTEASDHLPISFSIN
ncbi:hypothetical protein [Paenibacillus ferrarius]|uniref:hypothetical protein n=1 Tax=Paenibacillus ferrarius TaxID=1469647 RepID=UPI003D27FAE9